MKGFEFEKDLAHQTRAVKSTISVFDGLNIKLSSGFDKHYINPVLDINSVAYEKNIKKIQTLNNIKEGCKKESNVIDIMMETGTGKTYTYTKTIFELNKRFGIFKFIIVVPTLAIKAGTVNFLKSGAARHHFKSECEYGKTINLHIVESKKNGKKSFMPASVNNFVNAGSFDKNTIQVLIINAGMVNSDTMKKSFDKGLFDKYTVPFEALAAVKPFVIIDEPHKFKTKTKNNSKNENITWQNIQRMKPQFILRYGATFHEYNNLVYTLNALDSFKNNLVKGVIAHITEFESGKNVLLQLISTPSTQEATFRKTTPTKTTSITLTKGESLGRLHESMSNLKLEKIRKKPSEVVFSNGILLIRGDKINPYSYAETLQESMIKKAIENHFEIEKEFLTRKTKIKPLTLFFIDNIEEYRQDNGYLRKFVEDIVRAKAKSLEKKEKNKFYKQYLKKTLANISNTHGGYFSEDNISKDEIIEQEVNQILYEKETLLDLNNTRRFIFSKWTLREGWDNPNVFQICKLRSSGSEISKLQEVGRGLRLPVNEYMQREKYEQFYLNYFVDFTETDFVDKLVNEINKKSGVIPIEDVPRKLTDEIIEKICIVYKLKKLSLQNELNQKGIIDDNLNFLSQGFDYIKKTYPLIFERIDSNKVRKYTGKKNTIKIRTDKYDELKELWEKINQKVVLEYKFDNEEIFEKLFIDFLKKYIKDFKDGSIKEKIVQVEVKEDSDYAMTKEKVSGYNTYISTMKYSNFLRQLSEKLFINIKTLHRAVKKSGIEINRYLDFSTIRFITHKFNDFLMYNAIDKFSIEYQKVTNKIHPTKFTKANGEVKEELQQSDIGINHLEDDVPDNYLLEEIWYDSELEKENILTNISDTNVTVFTKIPRNSIRIPVAGGKTYSPDFAYVIKKNDGKKKLYFIVETKNVEGIDDLRNEEIQKIEYAKRFFKNINIEFKTQFSNEGIVDLINKIISDKC